MKNIDFSRLETWLHGLFAATISAGSQTGAAVLASYVTGSKIPWGTLGTAIGVSSLIAAFLYLKQSPLPDLEVTTTITLPPKTNP